MDAGQAAGGTAAPQRQRLPTARPTARAAPVCPVRRLYLHGPHGKHELLEADGAVAVLVLREKCRKHKAEL